MMKKRLNVRSDGDHSAALLFIRVNGVVPIFVPLRNKQAVRILQEQKRTIKRGDIYYADLSPTVGCEQGGIRPVLIVQLSNLSDNCRYAFKFGNRVIVL